MKMGEGGYLFYIYNKAVFILAIAGLTPADLILSAMKMGEGGHLFYIYNKAVFMLAIAGLTPADLIS